MVNKVNKNQTLNKSSVKNSPKSLPLRIVVFHETLTIYLLQRSECREEGTTGGNMVVHFSLPHTHARPPFSNGSFPILVGLDSSDKFNDLRLPDCRGFAL